MKKLLWIDTLYRGDFNSQRFVLRGLEKKYEVKLIGETNPQIIEGLLRDQFYTLMLAELPYIDKILNGKEHTRLRTLDDALMALANLSKIPPRKNFIIYTASSEKIAPFRYLGEKRFFDIVRKQNPQRDLERIHRFLQEYERQEVKRF